MPMRLGMGAGWGLVMSKGIERVERLVVVMMGSKIGVVVVCISICILDETIGWRLWRDANDLALLWLGTCLGHDRML